MADTSVDTEGPPAQRIASWGAQHDTRLDDQGSGVAAVTMWVESERREVARVSYSENGATPPVRWNWHGMMALEQYRRDAWDTQIYKEIALWCRERAS